MIRAVTIMTITMAIALVLHTIGWADKSATQPIQLQTLAEVDVKALDE